MPPNGALWGGKAPHVYGMVVGGATTVEAAWFAQAAFLFYKLVMSPTGKILVVGMGNLFYRDEGIGVHVVQETRNMKLPNHID